MCGILNRRGYPCESLRRIELTLEELEALRFKNVEGLEQIEGKAIKINDIRT